MIQPRVAVWTGLVTLFFLAGPNMAGSSGFENVVARVSGSVVTILGFDVGTAVPKSQGSGFFVGPNVVATNHHVIAGMGYVEVRTSMADPSLKVLRVLESDPVADVALVEVEEGGQPLPLSQVLPKVGEEILVISSPLGLEKTVSRGVISGLRDFAGRSVCQISAPVSRGSSGGPILNRQGEVLGMTSFTIGDELAQNLNFGVLARTIERLMEHGGGGGNTRLHIKTGEHGEIVITD